jgi:hypothetical protein
VTLTSLESGGEKNERETGITMKYREEDDSPKHIQAYIIQSN